MTGTIDPPPAGPPHTDAAPADPPPAVPPPTHKPASDAEAVREISAAVAAARRRAEQIRLHPELHHPRLVVSDQVRGTSFLNRIADVVNRFCGSMWVFLGITIGIVVWLFAGNVVGFDSTPWPLLLTILNLPQLSIMISLQVSANRAQAASDKRAIADHDTLLALHQMARQHNKILGRQDHLLQMLDNYTRTDILGRQEHIQATVTAILDRLPGPAGPAAPAAPSAPATS